ncbi:hypothetical protein DWW95_02685 [Ruminococcus sp. AF17-6LB]|uniref:hypothetical protein n=1 Tax=unclassified Ruminococcus TaxID=2608920 RepID=UPI000E4C402C|nr:MULTISPECIES: hypothetical protein [unclassified Ruminococcus]RGG73033.1 hypothetical protein DWW95_02685 [Ruminococcus sp. AF17-6LB]RGG74680.1 hypothetical protein DWW94_02680 [Ruminococcus sp. AF17-6]RGG75070.1 hypothetical protein DWW87_02605 [Ruminococcus sp. AF17-24]RGG81602.1 hypothetical protein DWW81_03460 [Ruminococcus sp. AF17-1AC]
MKKIVKRIAAMGAAVMMMSSMAIGASAANSYDLHYTKGAPSSDNVCEKWMYGIKAQNNGYLKSTCKSINTSGKFSVLAMDTDLQAILLIVVLSISGTKEQQIGKILIIRRVILMMLLLNLECLAVTQIFQSMFQVLLRQEVLTKE